MSYVPDRRSWLYLLFSGSPSSIDRVRIQKAMFIFAMRGRVSPEQRYDFVPYLYGPFSNDIYRDLGSMVASGHLELGQPAGTSSPSYHLTLAGERLAQVYLDAAPSKQVAYLRRVREFVLAMDFGRLLKAVYEAYPEYATRSVFRQA